MTLFREMASSLERLEKENTCRECGVFQGLTVRLDVEGKKILSCPKCEDEARTPPSALQYLAAWKSL